jgi:7-cyano-7-deazaguanine synthase in queuosine biosynthesis
LLLNFINFFYNIKNFVFIFIALNKKKKKKKKEVPTGASHTEKRFSNE